jgi:hypothetical protein
VSNASRPVVLNAKALLFKDLSFARFCWNRA